MSPILAPSLHENRDHTRFPHTPGRGRKTIAGKPHSLLTASGKPLALMIPVDSDSLDETLEALKIGRAQTALRALRDEAAANGHRQSSPLSGATRFDVSVLTPRQLLETLRA